MEKNLLTMITSLTTQIKSTDLRNNLKRMERQSAFTQLSETERVPYLLQFADTAILDYQEHLETNKKLRTIKYDEWKSIMLSKFDKVLSKKEFLRCKQHMDESCYKYFERMKKEGIKIIDDEELVLEIALLGLRKYKEEIETLALEVKEISEIFIDKVKGLEMIKKEAWARKKASKPQSSSTYSKTRKEQLAVNNVDIMDDIIKDDEIYLKGYRFRLIVDTGSGYSFITRKVLRKINLTPILLKRPVSLYTCLHEEFIVKEYVKVGFTLRGREYEQVLMIMPKREDSVVILGRDWLKKKGEVSTFCVSESPHKALERLYAEKKGGYRGIEKCEIKTKPGYKVVDYPYRIQQAVETKVDDEVQRLLKNQYIRESRSSWLNNVRPVEKPDGSVRLTTNLVKLNNIVELESYSLPNMEEILSKLHGMALFTKIDLKEGFFQIHLREQDKEKTAFRIKNRTYEWNRMPMGYKNSPAVFQRIMDKILESAIGTYCFVYVDDVLIFGKNSAEHDKAVITVCDLLSRAGFQANEAKVEFRQEEITFLGHRISYNKIYPKMNPKQGLEDYKTPENIEDIRRFLGIVNYYRRFIKNCSSKSEPLSRLLRKDVEFRWEEDQEQAFRMLIQAILGADCLAQPDFEKGFKLTTDASNKGLGAILSQQDSEGIERPIAFASRGLRPAEYNYSITEKEMLAALWGMEYFDFYLYGRVFELFTDHKALEAWTQKGKIKSARIERWNERLQRYTCNMKYKKPAEIEHADALSRSQDCTVATVESLDKEKQIMEAHEAIVHRGAKATFECIKEKFEGSTITFQEVKQTLKRCFRCKLYNPIKIQGWRYIESFAPGEKVAFDVIGPIEEQYIITAVDYFSRSAMAEVIQNRKAENVLSFLKKVHFEMSIETLVSDAARENLSESIERWVELNKIKRHITSSYHHNSNGRVERFNRTLGEAIKKQDSSLSLEERVKRFIEAYNNTIHSATGLTPHEALDVKNLDSLKQRHFMNRIEKYKKVFKGPRLEKLNLNDFVLIEDAIHKVKGQPKFRQIGEVVGILNNDTYWISNKTKVFKKHVTQLRKIDSDDFFL